ncbi:hypothetical protein MYRA21_0092 [Myroides sp. A21]|uniref:hypothetical protein n=1 Tax=Myroides sp. A21 TaxID=1583100 RepID=UPI00058602E5|nr:hypothetical protein [Myroides sp. A21]AJA67336.1 hypothetical protein MYRA21_0092 [Myroides sp. A21]
MNEQLTTYTIRSKNSINVWVFKYDLNGFLNEFKNMEGVLSEKQFQWFFVQGNFPYLEVTIKEWSKRLKNNFEIEKNLPVLDFEAIWKLYDNKVKRVFAEKQWNKLNDADRIKCFLHIPKYHKRIAKSKEAQAHFSTYINQRYFDDED